MSRHKTAVYLLLGFFLFYKFVTCRGFIKFFVNQLHDLWHFLPPGTYASWFNSSFQVEMRSPTNWTTNIEMHMWAGCITRNVKEPLQ
ncbi:unnamed protein product, partial [Musa textilis]